MPISNTNFMEDLRFKYFTWYRDNSAAQFEKDVFVGDFLIRKNKGELERRKKRER